MNIEANEWCEVSEWMLGYNGAGEVDLEAIKAAAKEFGMKIPDFLALDRNNDPFYKGTDGDHVLARWFKRLWDDAGYTSGVHLRRAHYYAVSQPNLLMHNGKPYENTQHCWGYLTKASKIARYLGYVKIEAVVDNKNPDPIVNLEVFQHAAPSFDMYGLDFAAPKFWLYANRYGTLAPYHIEIWAEKSTMNDVLEPIGKEYHANIVTFQGEASISAVYQLAMRIKKSGKPARIFYLSDYDPAGNSMSKAVARKLEWMFQYLNMDEADAKVKSLVLTSDQIRQYRLPRTPIKKSERRAASFEADHGVGAVELDALEALHPGELATIIEMELEPYIDEDLKDEIEDVISKANTRIQKAVDNVVKKYQPQIDALAKMKGELEKMRVDLSDLKLDISEHDAEEDDCNWLFDHLGRSYMDQIKVYAAHKKGDYY